MASLLAENWIPVLRRTGKHDWVAPHQIAEDDIVSFAANRPEFNGALAQFMIGLLQTTTPVATEGQWDALMEAPPTAETLRAWFAPVAQAFHIDGPGPRFMQDVGLEGIAEFPIDGLLVNSAGASTIDQNRDLFVKRDMVVGLCPCCATTALFALQINAPAGGAGQMTGLRGGGPLTTLVVSSPPKTLWHDLWLNVLPQKIALHNGGDSSKVAPHYTFSWLEAVEVLQPKGTDTQPLSVHPHHVYWATPRRILLDFTHCTTGVCDVCNRASDQLLQRYQTKPHGLNYKGPWRHPWSPYYETSEGWLPVHPQEGGFSYRLWLPWVLGRSVAKKTVQPASTVNYALANDRQQRGSIRLWVFGFDMKKMKCVCWYETTFPLYGLLRASATAQADLQSLLNSQIEAAELAAFYLRQAVRQAWFGDSDAKGSLGFLDKAFWDSTQDAFYASLQGLIASARTEAGIDMDSANFLLQINESWLQTIRSAAIKLFDLDIVGVGGTDQQNPKRIAKAHLDLTRNLNGNAIRATLHLAPLEKKPKASKKAAAEPQQT